MAQSNNSIKKILTVAFALCIVCSVIVSTAAVGLRAKQELNQELDRKSNILDVAGLYEPGTDVEEALRTGHAAGRRPAHPASTPTSSMRPPTTASRRPAIRPSPVPSRGEGHRRPVASGELHHRLSGRQPGRPEQIILPVRGQGLWGLMRGYLAVQGDGNTIQGITFYSHSETPGLGGEVDNPRWKSQWDGKEIFASADSVQPDIALVKGGASGETEVDALSGASLTSKGVTNLLQFWLSPEGFGEYLARFRSGIERETVQDASTDTEGA